MSFNRLSLILALIFSSFHSPSGWCQDFEDFIAFPIVDSLVVAHGDEVDYEYHPAGSDHPFVRDSMGNIHVLFTNIVSLSPDTISVLYYLRFNMDTEETQFEQISTLYFEDGIAFDPTLEIDNNQNLHAVWIEEHFSPANGLSRSLVYARAEYNHSTANPAWDWSESCDFIFSSFTMGPDFAFMQLPSMTLEQGFNQRFLHLSAMSQRTDASTTQIVYMRYDIMTHETVSMRTINSEYSFAFLPSLTLDAFNQPMLVWVENAGESLQVMFRSAQILNDDLVWRPIENISQTSAACIYPDICVDFNNNIHVVWIEASTNSVRIAYSRRLSWQDEFSESELLTSPLTIPNESVKIAASNNGNLHLVWSGQSIFEDEETVSYVFYNRFVSGVGWVYSAVLNADVDEPGYHFSPLLRQDMRGNFDVMWLKGPSPNPELSFDNTLIYGTMPFNDSPNPPSNIELTDAFDLDMPTADSLQTFSRVSWFYDDPDQNPQRLFWIQGSMDADFATITFNYIPPSDELSYSPAGQRFAYQFQDDEVFRVLQDHTYFYRIRAADTLHYDTLGQLVVNWSPWSSERQSFRIDNSPPHNPILSIGNLQLNTPNATVTYEPQVGLHLSACDSVDYQVRLWGLDGYLNYNNGLEVPSDATYRIANLPIGDGSKVVHAEFRDALGHTVTVRDTILLDHRHLVFPDRDNTLFIPELRDDGIPNNDSRLIIPAGAITDTLIIIPYTTSPLVTGGNYLDPDDIPTSGDHPRLDSQLVEALKFEVRSFPELTRVPNLKFNRDIDEPVILAIHFDEFSLHEGEVEPDDVEALRLFYWDGVNWTLLDHDNRRSNVQMTALEMNLVVFEGLDFLPSSLADLNPGGHFRYPDVGIFKIKSGFISPMTNLFVRPNPFTPNGDGVNDVVYFDFEHATNPETSTEIKIFDERGYLVKTLDSGLLPIVWDGTDDSDRRLEGGLYLYQIKHGDDDRYKQGSLVLIR